MNPGDTLAHYRVLERVGSGGMGEVYRAEDLRLRRVVALKMLGPDADRLDPAARLLSEARAASSLIHPNIAVVYEAGEAPFDGGRVGYIAMEFVEGRTLADVIGDGLPDLDRAFEIAIQIADALAGAHALGLVHRDLKPSNVMLTPSGRVKVLDFGVAQRHMPVASPDDETKSVEHPDGLATFVGTLPYASPEQATGRGVDARADLFSFGVLLYELVCGRQPFPGDNAAQVLEAILRSSLPAIDRPERDPRLPALDRLLRRMMARDPADRPPSAADVRAALEDIRSRADDAGGPKNAGERDAGTPAAERPAVAVPAFANISGEAEDAWLSAGLAETLTADAAQLEGIDVVPRARLADAARAIHDQTGETGETLIMRAARDLGARWIATGGFQRSGDAIRVTASLTDLVTGQMLATTKVDGRLSAIFDVQDRLVRELARTLRTAASPETSPSAGTRIADAYEAFSRGLVNRSAETFESLDRAVWFFERAVSLDPVYARAHLELGAAYGSKADYLSLTELHERAAASLRRAIELQPSSARAWRELGTQLVSAGRPDEGLMAIRRGVELDPEDAASCAALGRALFIGYARFAEAASWYNRALAVNPNGGWYALQRAHCAALQRDFTAGARAAERTIALQEAFLSGREGLFIAGGYIRAGHLAALQGRHREAIEHFERELDFLARTEHPLRHRILVELNVRLGASHRELGDVRKSDALFGVALESFDRRVRLGADDAFTRYYAAAVHAMRGDAEPAIAFLERAASQHRAFTIARARIEPEFERLRADPRFQALVQEHAQAI